MPASIKSIFQKSQKSLDAPSSIKVTGLQNLALEEIIAVANNSATVTISLDKKVKNRLELVHTKMLEQIKNGTPIYGATTAYGGQAGLVLTKGIKTQRLKNAQKLSYSLIHVDVSTGDAIPENITRAAMLIRLNMLAPGYSAVRVSTLEKLAQLLNAHITPIIGEFGTVGASGDLALNGRVIAALLQLKDVKVWDKHHRVTSAQAAMKKASIEKLILAPKEGLGLANGDNFSTAATALLADEVTKLLSLNYIIASLNIQSLKGTSRNFHPLLSVVRPHPGQSATADILRSLLKDSQLAEQELSSIHERPEGVNVQDVYSIRCLPQYYGPDLETLAQIWNTVEINANSVSDNPLWTTPETTTPNEAPYQWVSGGNFLAMHMADALDKLRKIAVHIVKQNDRHIARLINPQLSNGLPANLSDKQAVSQCTFKGVQTQMGMYETYATILAAPVSTAFGVHEQLNQDLTSHAYTSAIMTREVVKIVRYSLASSLIATCQAIDLRGGPALLSPSTQFMYKWLRNQVPYIKVEQPLGHYIEKVAANLLDKNLIATTFNHILKSL